MIIKKLPKISGRTFVCGDLHGSFSRVTQFLAYINFDKEQDRLISVGDLIDRGNDNESCLKLLLEPWFHAVKGNHEDMMAGYLLNLPQGNWWMSNGGGWGYRYFIDPPMPDHYPLLMDSDLFKALLLTANELPLMISVEKNDGTFFHVIHAELSKPKGLISNEYLYDEEKFNEIASSTTNYDGVSVLWRRSIFRPFYNTYISKTFLEDFKTAQIMGQYKSPFSEDCDIIYSGHTIVKQPIKFHKQINLDTCAYGSYFVNDDSDWCGLTVTEPETGNTWLVNNQGVTKTTITILPINNDRNN